MKYVSIENKDGLVRDIDSKAVINTNRTEYENYLTRKKQASSTQDKINQNTNDINEIKKDLTEVKDLLLMLIKQESN